jgi:TRAP-type C4-dicarboxylate transport system permease small subunit
MRWEWPEQFRGWRDLFVMTLILSAIFFVMMWLGYGNSDIDRFWGDPIPLSAALAKAPKLVLTVFGVLLVFAGLFGLRSSKRPNETKDK